MELNQNELNENAERVLKSNIEILYKQLCIAVDEYVQVGCYMGEFSYINAYLSATLNAIVSYVERLIQIGRAEETEVVEALKFANNLQKHNPALVRMSRSMGGIEFPVCFGEDGYEFLEVSVIWDECIGLRTKKQSQKNCYEKIFQQRPIIDTLRPIVEKLLSEGRIV